MFNKLGAIFSDDMAIDLGTANTLVYVHSRGIVLNQPSVVTMINHKGVMIPYAFGEKAKQMLGRTPGDMKAVRPMKDGVIADFKGAEEMVKYFIRSVSKKSMRRPRIIVCVPYSSTPVERRAIQESVESAGAREAFLIEEPMAAAIGALLPVTEPTGSMIVDIGGGTTEIGVVALGGVVVASSVRFAGDAMDLAIISHIRHKHNLLIGEATAEKVKKKLTSVDLSKTKKWKDIEIKGRDLVTGIPKAIIITDQEIAETLQTTISQITDVVRKVLESAPPELASDIVERGITLAGGGCMMHGMDTVIEAITGLKVSIAEEPLDCVVLGAGKVLEDFSNLRHVLFKQH